VQPPPDVSLPTRDVEIDVPPDRIDPTRSTTAAAAFRDPRDVTVEIKYR
jgi:hypothetical protein